MNETTLETLLTQKQVSDATRKSEAYFERARWAGGGPKFIKLGRSIRYRESDVLAWINASVRTSTSDSGEAA